MPDNARPFPTYPLAYLSDADLAGVSLAAEGLHARLMCLSAMGAPFGTLTRSDGTALTENAIMESKAVGLVRGTVTREQVKAAWDELVAAQRIARNDDPPCWYIPKMLRIGKAREDAVENGHRGGNPALVGRNSSLRAPRRGLTALPPAPIPPEQPEASQGPASPEGLRFTLEDCQRAAEGAGILPATVQAFFDHYAPVDFLDGAGRAIVNLKYALKKWQANEATHRKEAGPEQETDAGVLDYARQYRQLTATGNTERIGALRRKSLDNFGRGGWDRVTRAAKQLRDIVK